MECHCQECSKAKQRETMLAFGLGHDRRAERDTVDQRVQCKPERQADPTERMLAGQVLMMLVVMLAWTLVTRLMGIDEVARVAVLVRVHMEDSDEQEHRHQAAQRPCSDAIDRALVCQSMRQ